MLTSKITPRPQTPATGIIPTAQVADVFYVPSARAASFIELARLFSKHHVYKEIATPIILDFVGTEDGRDMQEIVGRWLWDGDREDETQIKRALTLANFVHPLEFSQPGRKEQLASLFAS
jgi:hypothetical protein